MLRHQKRERRRSAAGYNSRSWQTHKTIDETAAYLLTEDEFPDRAELPYSSSEWIEIHELEQGVEALMTSEDGDFQVSVTEYEPEWKMNDADITYFHSPDADTTRMIDRYVENI